MELNKSIDIDFLAHDELKIFQSFIKNHWSAKHIFASEESVFNWQHKNKKNYNYIIAKVNNQIIGIWGVIPLSHFDENLKLNQIFIALWRVLPGYGIAIGLQIFNEIIKKYKPDFILGLPVNPNVFKFYERQKFRIIKLRHHVFLSSSLEEFQIANVPKLLQKKNVKKYPTLLTKCLEIEDFLSLDTSLIYKNQLPLKSDAYIINRYMNHPVYDYKVYSMIKKDILKALLIIRPIEIHGRVIITIVDYIGSGRLFSAVGDFIKDLIKEFNAEYVDMYSHGILEEDILNAGFININENDGLIVPGFFEPFVKKNIQINCCYYSSDKKTRIRVFKGDGDADRPSII